LFFAFPAYFSFTGPEGTPYYVSALFRQNQVSYPHSLRAQLLGAIPVAAVHDTQQSTKSAENSGEKDEKSPPVYIEDPLKLQPETTVDENGETKQEQNSSVVPEGYALFYQPVLIKKEQSKAVEQYHREVATSNDAATTKSAEDSAVTAKRPNLVYYSPVTSGFFLGVPLSPYQAKNWKK